MTIDNHDFIPPFCPNPNCRFHHKNGKDKKWFIRYSFYINGKKNKQYQRYMCLGCNKTFSERTFASDYCLKLEICYTKLFAPLNIGISIEQWARALGHRVSVIENRLYRLGRWLVSHKYLTERELLRMRGWSLVRLGLVLKRLWIKASCPEHRTELSRCFLKQLIDLNNVIAKKVWRVLSWYYKLKDKDYYRPAFTYY